MRKKLTIIIDQKLDFFYFNSHVPVDRPYPVTIEKKVPYPVKVPVPHPVIHEKKVPYVVEKPVAYAQPVYIDRPVIHEKEVPLPIFAEKPVAVKVPVAPAPAHYEASYPEHHHHHHHIAEHQQHIPEHQHSYTSFSGYGGAYSYHH